jgi:hypothetical protein
MERRDRQGQPRNSATRLVEATVPTSKTLQRFRSCSIFPPKRCLSLALLEEEYQREELGPLPGLKRKQHFSCPSEKKERLKKGEDLGERLTGIDSEINEEDGEDSNDDG